MDFKIHSFSTRLSIYILIVTTTLFVVSFTIYFRLTGKTITDEAFSKSNYQVENLVTKIDAILLNIEQSVNNSVFFTEKTIKKPENIPHILENIIRNNNSVIGASVAFEPKFYSDNGQYFMCYTQKDSAGVISTSFLGDIDNYNYHVMDWYLIPKLLGRGYWSEPYFDAGAGNISMTTYTQLLHNDKGEFISVITADMSLEWITEMVMKEQPYPNSYSFMLSRYGFYIADIDSKKILNETFFTATQNMQDTSVASIGHEMLSMKSGFREFSIKEEPKYTFFAPIERVGWSVGIVSSQSDILAQFNITNRGFWVIISIALLLIFIFIILVINNATRPLKVFTASTGLIAKGNFEVELPVIKTRDEMYNLREAFINMQKSLKNYIEELNVTTKARERIESELEIATTIQMGMLPIVFPPHPKLPDIDLYATLVPAKEVGGDLYDFFICDDKFYFTVGDASGKGIPASLLMAVTSSLFRSVTTHISDPASILYNINNSITETNDANMFITLFVGQLDINNGKLIYSNAGHNAPVLLRNGKAEFIDVDPNIPLGIMSDIEFSSHEMILSSKDVLILYSDGLTEAENHNKELYSDERLIEVVENISINSTSTQFVEKIKKSVDDFVKDNEQSDDLTMLVLKLKDTNTTERVITIKNKIEEIKKITKFIEDLGEEQNFDPTLTMNLNLALEEAISNIILYAFPESNESTISLKSDFNEDILTFTITDSGIEFDPTTRKEADVTLPFEEREIGGLGIFLIRQIMNEVTYQRINGQNILIIKKKCKFVE